MKLLSAHCLKLFFSTCQKFARNGLGLAATCTGLPPIQVLMSQMTPDNFFAHNQGDANSLVRGTPLVPSLANLSA
jgi:hypothetical protein